MTQQPCSTWPLPNSGASTAAQIHTKDADSCCRHLNPYRELRLLHLDLFVIILHVIIFGPCHAACQWAIYRHPSLPRRLIPYTTESSTLNILKVEAISQTQDFKPCDSDSIIRVRTSAVNVDETFRYPVNAVTTPIRFHLPDPSGVISTFFFNAVPFVIGLSISELPE
ncbi:hypothetical protein F5146DRAFT_1001582 [Armillaria mellea]|nr:hypothetical protein F5146DRAFT_1001582 [Armillaria mellea]